MLGIHASQVKIVSVYEGSVIINYEITTSTDEDDEEELEIIRKKHEEAYKKNLFDFGAEILDWNSAVSMAGSDTSVST